ncbi:hypothetical protein [Plesiomonas sp.]|uniref:hypothetical protein n=1 Tax=Plesiomonas sp. TaxID=2486279 RepID=UPI003F3B2AEE
MSDSITSRVSPSLIRNTINNVAISTPLSSQIKACRNGISATEPWRAHRSDTGKSVVNFTMAYAWEARDALFANGRDPQGASALFLKSSNRYAKEEITQFAKVYYQLKQQKLSKEDSKQLDTLAAKYVEKMVDDKLGDISGFGAWTKKTSKSYQQRNKLEHALAEIVSKVCGDQYNRLADSLLPAVSQFILSSIEAELGRPLEDSSFNTVMGLVDNIAKNAWESLRGYRTELLRERGAGMGKLSRDLDTVAILPELLRNLLPLITEQLKPDSAHSQTGTHLQPDAGDTDTKPQPSSPAITINVGGIHITHDDHSIQQDDHSDRRRYNFPADMGTAGSAQATATANASKVLDRGIASEIGTQDSPLQGVLTQTRVVGVKSEVATSEPTHRLQPAYTGLSKSDLHDAARNVTSTLTALLETANPSAVATSASRVTLVNPTVTKIASSDVDLSPKLNTKSLQRQDTNNVNGRLDAGANKAAQSERVIGEVDWERLRLQGQLKTLPNENVLRGSDFQYGDNAAWALIHAVRGVLTPAPTLSVTQRAAYDRWLNQILPNEITAQSNLPSGQDQLPRLSALLKHPDIVPSRPKLEAFVKQMLRVTNLAAYSERPVIRALLDGLDVDTEKAVATPVADPQVALAQSLHNAARGVTSALTELIDIANPKTSAVEMSASHVTPTATESTLSPLASSSVQRSLIRGLENEVSMSRVRPLETNKGTR